MARVIVAAAAAAAESCSIYIYNMERRLRRRIKPTQLAN